jgi:hypothetical protein
MVILKFALALFLLGMILLLTVRSSPGVISGGPYYYSTPEDLPNPVQPRFRCTFAQAHRMRAYWEAWYDGRGRLVEIKRKEGGAEKFKVTYLWGPGGRLRLRQWEREGVIFRVDAPQAP